MSAEPLRVLIAGAGVGGLECALALHELAADRVEVAIADPAGEYVERAWSPDEVLRPGAHPPTPLDDILEPAGTTILRDALAAVDIVDHVATLRSGRALAYDALVLAVGATTGELPKGAIPFDPGDLDPVRRVAAGLASGDVGRLAIVVPPGRHWSLPGYELALVLARHAREHGRAPSILVVAPEPRPLSIFGAAAADALQEELDAAGVELRAGRVADLGLGDPATLVLHPGRDELSVDAVIALPRLLPREVPGIGRGTGEFVRVDAAGRVDGAPGVYVVGDAARRPLKVGVLAAEQAEAAARDIAQLAGAAPPRRLPRHELPAFLLTGAGARPLGPTAPEAVDAAGLTAKVQAPRLARRLEHLAAG